MFLPSFIINPKSLVAEIVAEDYRTADVFRKYEIEYCCGGKWPLETICLMKGIDLEELQKELHKATRNMQLPCFISFPDWSVDFLIDYIVNIHHCYLKKTLPELWPQLNHFVNEHLKKYPYLYEVQTLFRKLQKDMIPHLLQEEQEIFPYIRQLAHAHESKDSLGSLLVRTLRKPVEKIYVEEQEILSTTIFKFRELTNNYTPPEKACTSHRVIFSKLKELDNDMVQHIYLENDILFPGALAMEKELLSHNG